MDCREFELFLHAYVDGEFDESERARIEAHLESCDTCRQSARQESLFRSQLYDSYHAVAETAPDHLKSRILSLLEPEAQPQAETLTPAQDDLLVSAQEPQLPPPQPSPDLPPRPPLETLTPPKTPNPTPRSQLLKRLAGGLFVLLGLGILAVPIFSFQTRVERTQTQVTVRSSNTSTERTVKSVTLTSQDAPIDAKDSELDARPIVEEAVHWHRRNVPIEVTGPSDRRVRHWFRDKVNFPVRLPRFSRTQRIESVNLLGARLSNVRERQAAFVLYEANGNKVSVLVFNRRSSKNNARRVLRTPSHPNAKPKPRRPIYFDNSGGYNVALVEDNGVTYSITSELPQHEMAELVQAAFHE